MPLTQHARRHGGTAKTKIISARGPRRTVRRNSTRGCHAQKIGLILVWEWGGQLIRQLPFPCLDGEAPTRSIFFSSLLSYYQVLPGITLLMVTEVK